MILNHDVINSIFDKDQVVHDFFENSPDLLAIVNEGKFKVLSKNWQRTFGRTEEELMNMKPDEVLHPDDAQVTLEARNKLHSEGRVNSFINRYRTKSGEYIKLNWSARIDPSTGFIYAIARVID